MMPSGSDTAPAQVGSFAGEKFQVQKPIAAPQLAVLIIVWVPGLQNKESWT
jgi:hypothetical protein